MNNPNNTSGGAPVRHKLKKVKRPIKRPTTGADTLSVPSKAIENPTSRPVQTTVVPAATTAALTTPTTSEPQKVDAFSLDAFLDGDNLPTLQQDSRLQQNNFERNFIRDEDITPAQPSWKDRMIVGDLYTGFAVFVTAAVFLLFGILFAKIFLSGPTTVQNGLQGVVINSEVPRGRARCGVAEKTQGCVLYIMNPQRQDLNGRDFYDLAAQLTGRQRFMIETGNMRYSSIKIRPGEIAQLNIPPLQ